MQRPGTALVNRIRTGRGQALEFCSEFPRPPSAPSMLPGLRPFRKPKRKQLPKRHPKPPACGPRSTRAIGWGRPCACARRLWRRDGSRAQECAGACCRHWGRLPNHTPPEGRPQSARAVRDDGIA